MPNVNVNFRLNRRLIKEIIKTKSEFITNKTIKK